jgi:hypothetical protein
MDIFLDLETIPDQRAGALERIRLGISAPGQYKKPESIAEWLRDNADSEAENQWRKTALDGGTGQVICIGYAVEDEPVQVISRHLNQSEGDLLRAFNKAIGEALDDRNEVDRQITYIGHNAAGFDLPFLYKRYVVNGIKPRARLFQHARPGSDNVADTMLLWAGYGNRISLDNLCSALGIPSPKDGIDGSQVWDFVQAGKIAEVAEYCKRDVEAVRTIYRRLNFLEVAA